MSVYRGTHILAQDMKAVSKLSVAQSKVRKNCQVSVNSTHYYMCSLSLYCDI